MGYDSHGAGGGSSTTTVNEDAALLDGDVDPGLPEPMGNDGDGSGPAPAPDDGGAALDPPETPLTDPMLGEGDEGLVASSILVVPTITARNNIPARETQVGMLVNVLDDGAGQTVLYQLTALPASTSGNWVAYGFDASMFFFGGGSDGSLAPGFGNIVLTRDTYYRDVSPKTDGTDTIDCSGYKLYCLGTLDISGCPAGTIFTGVFNGNNGAAGGGAGAASTSNFTTGKTLGGGNVSVIAGAGAAGAGNQAGASNGIGFGCGGDGGASGAGGSGNGGANAGGGNRAGGTVVATGINIVGTPWANAPSMVHDDLTTNVWKGGNGGAPGGSGGGGGGDGTAGGGGAGGGGGGGNLVVMAGSLDGAVATGALAADGGDGGTGGTKTGTGVNGNGGTGGASGQVTLFVFNTNTRSAAAAGTAGSGPTGTVGGGGGHSRLDL